MRKLSCCSIALLLLACCSCISFHGPTDLRRDLTQATGVELERQSGVSVGPVGVMLARWFTEEEEVPLKGVRRVQVGVYEVTDSGESGFDETRVLPPDLPGWQTVVRVQDDDENVFVMLHEKDEKIRGILVVVMDREEWVLVRIKGKLDHMVERAMEMAFDEADRPELYEPALAEYRDARAPVDVPEPS